MSARLWVERFDIIAGLRCWGPSSVGWGRIAGRTPEAETSQTSHKLLCVPELDYRGSDLHRLHVLGFFIFFLIHHGLWKEFNLEGFK